MLQCHHFSTVLSPNNHVEEIKISFGNFKHSCCVRPFSIVSQHVCSPVQSMLNFLCLGRDRPGRLFMDVDCSTITGLISPPTDSVAEQSGPESLMKRTRRLWVRFPQPVVVGRFASTEATPTVFPFRTCLLSMGIPPTLPHQLLAATT